MLTLTQTTTQTIDPQSLAPFELARTVRGLAVLATLAGAQEALPTYDDLTPKERRQGFVWALTD